MQSKPSMITALCCADTYPHPVCDICLIETHISWVFLTGEFAYKIKKPVNFGFLDFSTLEKRRFYCQEEIRLNQRLAKDWYLEVVPITGTLAQPVIGGEGEAIEYAVKMRQFPTSQTLKEIALAGQLGLAEIDQIADLIADFHGQIERASDESPYGKDEDIKHWFDENFQHIKPLLADEDALAQIERIAAWSDDEWRKLSPHMAQRKQQGFIREGHGDLHLGNMTLINGKVVAFDCIEFNPKLRWIDVISEIAFLVMDLLHLGFDEFAYRFLNRYLQHTGDYPGIALLSYYLVYRMMVRAKVALLRSTQTNEPEVNAEIKFEYQSFVNLAERLLNNKRKMLLITHGFSGSGKSTYASQLAEKIGAIQIRSDVERKRLFGFHALAATDSLVDDGLYSEAAGQKTYAYLADLAHVIVDAGFPVIIDAAFLKNAQRRQFKQLAEKIYAEFLILDFHASEQTLHERLNRRENDASEATIAVLKQQQRTSEALDAGEQNLTISIKTEENQAIAKALSEINRRSKRQF